MKHLLSYCKCLVLEEFEERKKSWHIKEISYVLSTRTVILKPQTFSKNIFFFIWVGFVFFYSVVDTSAHMPLPHFLCHCPFTLTLGRRSRAFLSFSLCSLVWTCLYICDWQNTFLRCRTGTVPVPAFAPDQKQTWHLCRGNGILAQLNPRLRGEVAPSSLHPSAFL